MRLRGSQAIVVISNDDRLLGIAVEWDWRDTRIPPDVLNRLRLDIAVHQSFAVDTEQWHIVCGVRDARTFVLPAQLDEWGVQLVRHLIASRSGEPAGDQSRLPAVVQTGPFVLCAQPIFSIATRRAARVELLTRSLSPDGTMLHWPQFTQAQALEADRWVLMQALERAGRGSVTNEIRKAHINVSVYASAHRKGLLQSLSSASAAARAATAFEIQTEDFRSTAFVHMVRSLAEMGVEVGVDLPDCTTAQLLQLSELPVRFVKIPAALAANGWPRALPWDVVLTSVETQPQWDMLASVGGTFAQGFGVEPPLSAVDFANAARQISRPT